MAGTNTLALTAEQRKIFSAMNENMRDVATEARRLAQLIPRQDLRARWELGQQVKLLTDEKKYGDKAIPSLAAFLGPAYTPNKLWLHRMFAMNYKNWNDVEKLLKAADAHRSQITWTHFAVLSGLVGEKSLQTRLEAEKAIIEDKLTVAQLTKFVQARESGGKTRAPSVGGQVRVPESVEAGLHEIVATGRRLQKRVPGWMEVVVAGLDGTDPEDVSEELMEAMRTALEVANGLHKDSGEVAKHLVLAIRRANRPALPAPAAAANGKANGAAKKNARAMPDPEEEEEDLPAAVRPSRRPAAPAKPAAKGPIKRPAGVSKPGIAAKIRQIKSRK